MKLKDLEKFRDENGFIDFDKILELKVKGEVNGLNEGLEETRGSNEKFKRWYELEDCDMLLRSTMFVGEIANYTVYAEMIIEELAKQVGLPCAHYDLIKINGLEGNLSVSLIDDKENQEMTALSQNQADIDIIAGSTIYEALNKIKYFSVMQGIGGKETARMNVDFFKMIIFDLFTMQTDRHLGNISLMNDSGKMSLSGLYDNECSLMLDIPKKRISEMLRSEDRVEKIEKMSYIQEGCINLPDKEIKRGVSYWESLLLALYNLKYPAIQSFMKECSEKLNIEDAIRKVEERIGAEIPKEAKEFAIIGFNARKKTIELDLGFEKEGEKLNGTGNNYEYPI